MHALRMQTCCAIATVHASPPISTHRHAHPHARHMHAAPAATRRLYLTRHGAQSCPALRHCDRATMPALRAAASAGAGTTGTASRPHACWPGLLPPH